MDAELFRKVVPSHCLGSTWGKRNKPGNEHLAPTVQATVDHFRRVVSLVVTTCLGDPSMTAQDRARVVEHWIQVAQECKILKNFSSPCTVISVLQKTSICHLKNTWGKFPGGAFHVCPPEINPQRVQEKEQQQQQGNEINLKKGTEVSSCGTPCRGGEGGGNQRPSGQNSPWFHPLYLTLSGRLR
ncbi:ral guanine nucleotide dissociation stimulator-like isoform X2 [Diceros bicornis minor]|uniref:ral guanine nucleotide dissociation stimulator-like isoform X2 n=1 Tax=Diceros bicornis minor TaxID=77932 RepID=UPI0026EAFF3D|nr:ral guanine nucleotide dissociation stimulator-like isoform X2 [Diceros bicornis minor]